MSRSVEVGEPASEGDVVAALVDIGVADRGLGAGEAWPGELVIGAVVAAQASTSGPKIAVNATRRIVVMARRSWCDIERCYPVRSRQDRR